MNIGNASGGSTTLTETAASHVLRFEGDRVIVVLTDRREISVPLDYYPTLKKASPAQRDQWEPIGPGEGFHWEELDLDLSVEGLINGWKEGIPKPPSWELLEKLQKQLVEEKNEHSH